MPIDEQPEIAVLSPRPRRAITALPEDPTEEELARDWTLSESDCAEVRRCRGEANRRRFAIQLCALRQYGRFLEEYARVPVKILNHLGRQLHLPPVLSLLPPDRPATETAQQQRIRAYPGYQPFDEETRSRVEDHLRIEVAQGVLPAQLLQHAEDFLRFGGSSCPRPPRSAAWRLRWARPADRRFSIASPRLTAPICEAIDKLLVVAGRHRASSVATDRRYY